MDVGSIPVIPKGKLKVYFEDRIAKIKRELKSSEPIQSTYLRKVG